MTISEILKEREPYAGRFPKKAMQAAIEQHEAITPELLRVVAAFACGGVCGLTFRVNRLTLSRQEQL